MEIKIKTNKTHESSLFGEHRFAMVYTPGEAPAENLPPVEAKEKIENEQAAIIFATKLEIAKRPGDKFQESFGMEPNPYREDFLKFFKESGMANETSRITDVKNIVGGIRISFAGADKPFDITGKAHKALIWSDIVAKAEKEYKGTSKFNIGVFAAEASKEGSGSSELADEISKNGNTEDLQKDYMRNRSQAAMDFKAAVEKARNDLYVIYNNENLKDMSNEDLSQRIRACLRARLDKNSPVYNYLDNYDAIVDWPIKGREKDKKNKPAVIYVKSTKTGKGDIGMKIALTKDNITVNDGSLESDLPGVGNSSVEIAEPLKERKEETVAKLKSDMEVSWERFMKDGHPESNWPEVYGLSGHRKNLADEYSKFLRIMIDQDKDVQRGLGLLTTADFPVVSLPFNGNYKEHHLTVSYVRKGEYPGIQMRWYKNGSLVDETKDVYPIASKSVNQMDISSPIDPKISNKSSVEQDKLYANSPASIFAGTRLESDKLKDELKRGQADKAQKIEAGVSYSESTPFSYEAKDVPNLNTWQISVFTSLEGINPDKWNYWTPEGRAETRNNWILLGLPAGVDGQAGDKNVALFDGMFNQFRKCSDEKFLAGKSPEVQSWYRNPENKNPDSKANLAKIDKPFVAAMDFYSNVKTVVQKQLEIRNSQESLDKSSKTLLERVGGTAGGVAKENWLNIRNAVKKDNWMTIGIFAVSAYCIYQYFLNDKETEGWRKNVKPALLLAGALGGLAYVAKIGGYDVSNLWPRGADGIKGTPFEPLTKVVPEMNGVDGEKLNSSIMARAYPIPMARLYQEYQNSTDKKTIDPKRLSPYFKEFDKRSSKDLENNKNYNDASRQLYLMAEYMKLAYERTLGKTEKKTLGEKLSEHPFNKSSVLGLADILSGSVEGYEFDLASGEYKKQKTTDEKEAEQIAKNTPTSEKIGKATGKGAEIVANTLKSIPGGVTNAAGEFKKGWKSTDKKKG